MTKEEQLYHNKKPKEKTFGKPKKSWTFGKKKYTWNKKSKTKPKVRKTDIIDDDYSNWLATQPCVVTGQRAERGAGAYNIHCHHIHRRGLGRNDYMQVPLMGYVHSWGDKAYHNNTKEDFCKKNNLIVDDIIEYFEKKAQEFIKKYQKDGGVIKQNNLHLKQNML